MQDYFDQHLKAYSKLIVLKPYGAVLVEGYDQHHPNIKSYPGKATDVWVATYPKCGESCPLFGRIRKKSFLWNSIETFFGKAIDVHEIF